MSQIHPHPARCNYRACHHCDRKLQERTWLSLNEICNDPDIKPPSAWDLWETPVSDVNLVSNLGLRCPPAPVPPPHRSYVYRGSQRHRIQRVTGNYLVGHGSSLSLRTLMSTLSTIEEISEETELRQTEVRI
ncbi:hypothetical protein BDW59DRAFT_144923 [Aspergillus cavernicola]|uniref:Uncharacterized protein n=1 Tax=Aspergillus cavernicola TaxID=176166 RepID=A0ABR4IFQ4_9EURO